MFVDNQKLAILTKFNELLERRHLSPVALRAEIAQRPYFDPVFDKDVPDGLLITLPENYTREEKGNFDRILKDLGATHIENCSDSNETRWFVPGGHLSSPRECYENLYRAIQSALEKTPKSYVAKVT